MNFTNRLSRVVRWGRETHGEGDKQERLLNHIALEIEEVRESEGSPTEWVDLVILALDGLTRSYGDVTPLIAATKAAEEIERKWDKNTTRDWPDPKKHPDDKPMEHIR